MRFDVETLVPGIAYKVMTSTIVPRPIGWVSTRSKGGVTNLAPYSFFNGMGGAPPVVALGMMRAADRGLKDSARNIIETGEFVVNLVPEALADVMNASCAPAPPDVSEFDLTGLTPVDCAHVAAPRVAESPVSFECKVLHVLETGPQQVLVVGSVLAVHVADEFVMDAARGYIDTPALGLIGRMHGAGWYTRTSDMFQLDRPA